MKHVTYNIFNAIKLPLEVASFNELNDSVEESLEEEIYWIDGNMRFGINPFGLILNTRLENAEDPKTFDVNRDAGRNVDITSGILGWNPMNPVKFMGWDVVNELESKGHLI